MRGLNRNKKPFGRIVKKRHSRVLTKLAIAFVIVLAATGLYVKVYPHTHDAKVRQELESKSIQLNVTKQELEKQIKAYNLNEEQRKQIEDQNKQLNQQLEDTKKQLEAKRATKTAYAATPSYDVPANGYKAFIYEHESGNNPTSQNSIGCYGLGQDCNGVVKNQCGASYACQDAFFEGYMQRRYGSWANAYAFWMRNHWW